ncbi:MAG: hypothetical protein AB7N70_13445 [Dehalococcoidia bacterium]
MNARRQRLRLGLPALAILALLLAGACGEDSTAAEIPGVTVVARDYAFEMPEEVPAGRVRLTLRNEGPEPHHAQPARLKDGVTLEQFTAQLQQGPEAALPLLSFPGGPGPVASGTSQDVTLDLVEGQYVMLCFVESPDGAPHLAKGMMQPFRVTGTGIGDDDPRADDEVTLRDFGFTLPESMAGDATLKVINAGPQVHEMGVVKPAEGTTVRDVLDYFHEPQGPPPFAPAGGMQALDPNASGWLHLDLEPGAYMAICLIPDPGSGRPHADLGMIQEFTVE